MGLRKGVSIINLRAFVEERFGPTAWSELLAMLPEIETLVPEVRGHVVRARVYRFEEGTPVAHPSFASEREHGRALAAALQAPVVLAGDYLTAPLIEGAVASGTEAAVLLENRLASRR